MPKQDDWIEASKPAPKKLKKIIEIPGSMDDDELNANWLHNENWKKKDKKA